MAKKSGLNDRIFIGGTDLSGDISAIDMNAKRGLLETPVCNAYGMVRLAGLADGKMAVKSWFNPAAGAAHKVLRDIPSADVLMLWQNGAVLGQTCSALTAKQLSHDGQRQNSGALAFDAAGEADAGVPLEFGTSLTAGQVTHASAGSETGEVTAQTTKGGVGYLQNESAATGTAAFVIEHSSDTTNGIDGSWSTLLTFAGTSALAPFGERKTVTGTIKKGLRATTTGSFTTAKFAMGFRRGTADDDEDLS